jgi:class 3 adenylate cyclase/tetratricopeptide (TPR) repeat protein
MASLADTLASYVPNLVIRRIQTNPEPISAPTFESFDAAAMYADITGFTALTERLDRLPLAERGAGAEALTRVINAYFEQLIELIIQHRGDIVKFTGDGMLALWPVREGELPGTLRDAILLAGECGLKVQEALNDYEMEDGTHLSMRLGVGAGTVNVLQLGGKYERWEMLIAGEAITQTSAAEKLAKPGQIVLSSEAHALVREVCTGNPITSAEDADLGAQDAPLHLTRVDEPVIRPPLPAAQYPEEMVPVLRPFIPQAIYKHLDAGLSAWLAELRRLTVLFINVPDLDHTSEAAIERAHQVMRALQTEVYRYEGSINKLNVDDKGATLIAAYGLPPFSHENDPERGVQAALAIQRKLAELGTQGYIGVSTGLTFCGVIGSARRREYTMMGDAVNLSARLMQAAGKLDPDGGGAILCDPNTHQGTQSSLDFSALEPITVKGKKEPIRIFRPTGEKSQREIDQQVQGEWVKMLVGRREERFSLAENLQSLQRGGRGSTFVIEGEAGIGKSRLIQDLIDQAKTVGVAALNGGGNSINRETLYLAWRPVFDRLFRLGDITPLESRPNHQIPEIIKLFNEMGVAHLAPLLNDVLNLGLEENEVTREMGPQVRADNTRNLLISILQYYCQNSPTVLVIEDAQWIDSASWALLNEVWLEVRPLLLLVATRPMSDPNDIYTAITAHADTHHFKLSALSPAETKDLICRALGVAQIPEGVADMIHERAGGHPFYSEELAYSLRDSGVLTFTNGSARLAPGADVGSLSFPDTVQGVVTSRIDRLDPTEKLTLKVASVIGRSFGYPTLYDIHPIITDKPRIQQDLNALGDLDITALEQTEPELSYVFKHIITQEVSYNLMSFAQRQQLHHSAAEWYEHRFADDQSAAYSLLAYHWSKAGVGLKSIDYYEKAGEKALLGGAYLEAIRALREAIDWNRKVQRAQSEPQVRVTLRKSVPLHIFREARWYRQMGEAYLGLGQLPDSHIHLLTALELLGRPSVIKPWQLILRTLRHLTMQVAFRISNRLTALTSGEYRDALRERARAFRMMGEISFFENDTLSVIHSTITSVNLNERAGKSAELAELFGNMGLIMSFIPIHKAARFYFRRGREVAESVERTASKAYVGLVNGLYLIGIGDWAGVDEVAGEAVQIFRQIGDRRRLGEALSILCMAAHLRADYAKSIQLYKELFAVGADSHNVQQETWGIDGQAGNYFRIGEFAEATRLLAEASPRLDVSKDVSELFIFKATCAVLNLYEGNFASALATARQATAMGVQASSVYSMLEGFAGLAEVILILWERQYPPPEGFSFPEAGAQVVKDFAAYAKRFPIGRPRALVWQGQYDWLSGSHEKAQRIWARALQLAKEMKMPYEEALAHKIIGAHLSEMEPNRKEHLAQAKRIHERLGARADLIGP